jgi:uncharacterized protein YciW
LDEALVEAVKRDYRSAPLSDDDRLMLDYVAQLTRDATVIGPEYHQRLRQAGFDDVAILQITLIASWFSYINRVADALGVGREAVVAAPATGGDERIAGRVNLNTDRVSAGVKSDQHGGNGETESTG